MGYSSNPAIVEQRADLVSELAEGNPQVWTCEPDMQATQRLASRIRETLYVAGLYPDKFPELASAQQLYSIHIVRAGRIEARLKPTPVEVTTERGDIAPSSTPTTPIHGIVSRETGFKRSAQVGLSTAAEVIESWQAHLPSNDPLYLANTQLDLPELMQLYTFCEKNKPRLMILVGDNHITVSPHEIETAALAAWHPPVDVAAVTPEEFDL